MNSSANDTWYCTWCVDEHFMSLLSGYSSTEKRKRFAGKLSSESEWDIFLAPLSSSFLFFLLLRRSLALLELSLDTSEELSVPPPLSKASPLVAAAAFTIALMRIGSMVKWTDDKNCISCVNMAGLHWKMWFKLNND